VEVLACWPLAPHIAPTMMALPRLLTFVAIGAAPALARLGSPEPAAAPNSSSFVPWPPTGGCTRHATEAMCAAVGEACAWRCEEGCFPDNDHWGCGYYGGITYEDPSGDWECGSGWLLDMRGCYCWSSYSGSSRCFPCPNVAHCAGREFTSCGGRASSGIAHLHPSTCSQCMNGYIPSSDGTACLPATLEVGQCEVEPASRADCGFLNISRGECEARSCCWGGGPAPNPSNIPWCFHPVAQP